jgi:four helix bundle protein
MKDSPALNYSEAQSAESRNDFIHKMKIILKELRESLISIKIIERKRMHDSDTFLKAKDECNKLVAIFVKSIETAKKNNIKQ